ncbi:MAG: type II toxin-antitoxin system RelE/ParE family toxin [Prolixibacteraceae bacterium]|nr:type II toxin-antitoxin system RelE/ParE family toxin [Prolixibacteraceae bacterium]
MNNYKIIWTSLAKKDLKNIFDYWKSKSLQGAKNVVSDIFNSPQTISYANQFQIDDINPKYRRIVVRSNYKVLYKAIGDKIYIMGVISTFQSPNVSKNK